MAMQLERVGGGLFQRRPLCCSLLPDDAAFAQEHRTYRCKVADVVTLGDDSGLQPDSNPSSWMRQLYDDSVLR
jgi:hypothetical protein